MPVAFNNVATTDFTFEGGVTNGAKVLARPSSCTTNDFVILARHHASSNVTFSSGGTDGALGGSAYLASGSTASMLDRRRVTSPSDQTAGWTWTSSGASWCHAAIRLTGVDTAASNPFTPGLNVGGLVAGDIRSANAASITATTGDGAANNMGVVVLVSTQPVSSVSSGWTAVELGSTQRYITFIHKAYTSTVTADAVTITFASNATFMGRHGVITGTTGAVDATVFGSAVFGSAVLKAPTVITESPNVAVGASSVGAVASVGVPQVSGGGLRRITVVGDSITDGNQIGVDNRWMSLLFGSQGTLNRAVWWEGASSGVPFPGKRIYSAAYQGDSVIETTNRVYSDAKTDVAPDAQGRTTDLMIIMLGANDELDNLPGGLTQSSNNTSTSPTDSLQWFENNVVQLANGGIQDRKSVV